MESISMTKQKFRRIFKEIAWSYPAYDLEIMYKMCLVKVAVLMSQFRERNLGLIRFEFYEVQNFNGGDVFFQ